MSIKKHFIIDWETGGDSLNGKILNVAWTHFDTDQVENIDDIVERTSFLRLNYKHTSQDGYVFNKDTMEWWSTLPKELQAETFNNPEQGVDVLTVLNRLADDIQAHYSAKNCMWSRGTDFDLTILRRLLKDNGMDDLYPFWMNRDVRTFCDTLNIVEGLENPWRGKIVSLKQEYVAHDPRYDIAKDIQQIQIVFNTLSGNI